MTSGPDNEKDPALVAQGDVVVVGGGYAGLSAASSARQAGAGSVLLVDADARHDLYPRLAATSARASDRQANVPIESVAPAGLITERAVHVDPHDRTVTMESGDRIGFGALVIASGARTARHPVAGLGEHALLLDSAVDARTIARRVERRQRVVVAGGGPTGVELAGAAGQELGEAAIVVEIEDRLLPAFPERHGRAARHLLTDLGVGVITGHSVERLTEDGAVLDDGRLLPGPVVWAAGYSARPELLLDEPPTREGRIEVDDRLRILGVTGLFAAGDIAAATDRAGDVLPMTAQVAVQAGSAAGRNAARAVAGKPLLPARLSHRGFLIPIGRRRGVGRIGPIHLTGAFGSRLVPLLHEIVDRRHLLRVGGWRAALRGELPVTHDRGDPMDTRGAEPMADNGRTDHGPSIKDDERYERLREKGMSKEKAARIANTDRSEAGRRGGSSPPYEDWTKDELYERAAEIGIDGRSRMNKGELIAALREH